MYQLISKKLNQKRKGFTLIELVVVIAILGILAAIAIPRLTNSRDRAEESAAVASARTISSAVVIYQAENGATDEPTLSNLGNYVTDAAGLVSDGFVINYVAGTGEIYSITTPVGTWTPGSEEIN